MAMTPPPVSEAPHVRDALFAQHSMRRMRRRALTFSRTVRLRSSIGSIGNGTPSWLHVELIATPMQDSAT